MSEKERFGFIRAEYEDFKPETMRGYSVQIDNGEKVMFDDLIEARVYAEANSDRVGYSSSVDAYRADLERAQATAVPPASVH